MEKNIYKRHYNQNVNHWWFEARKIIISNILKKHSKDKKKNILDYGCGVGINLGILSKFGKVFYYDKSKLAIDYVKKIYAKKKFFYLSKNKLLKYKKKFDIIIAADVIEHIKNDKKKINELSSLLKKNGFILITVPAYQKLFSSKDISLKHYRRYTKDGLNKVLKDYFHEIEFTYFNFILFIPIAIIILFFKITKINFIDSVERKPNFLINKVAFYIFALEAFLIDKIKLPFGMSILFFGKKID
jgi:SAM-dependent methyltransferase